MRWGQLKKRDADLERELRSDLELEEEEQREHGLSADEARYTARRAFGNPTLIKEETHEAWGWGPFERLFQDVRYALRQFRRSSGFTLIAVLILALGIGAVTAVFSLIDAVLLKMLPVENPEQLVQLKSISPAFPTSNSDSPIANAFSYPAFQKMSQQTQVLAGVLAFRKWPGIDFEVDGHSGPAEGQLVSGSYFSVLGVRAIRGRTILPIDASVAGQNPVAVIGYDYWRTRFALDPNIVGKKVLLNNAPFTIIGVTEPEFTAFSPAPGSTSQFPLPQWSC
jgi:hypothetical protein